MFASRGLAAALLSLNLPECPPECARILYATGSFLSVSARGGRKDLDYSDTKRGEAGRAAACAMPVGQLFSQIEFDFY